MKDGKTIYAWTVEEPDGSHGLISAVLPEIGYAVLVISDYTIATTFMQDLALNHARSTGKPVRLGRYERAEILTTIRTEEEPNGN